MMNFTPSQTPKPAETPSQRQSKKKKRKPTGYNLELSPADNEKLRLDSLVEWYECTDPERKAILTAQFGFGLLTETRVSPLANHPRRVPYRACHEFM